MKCSTFQWSKNLDNIIIVLTRSLMIDQRNKRPFVKKLSHPRLTYDHVKATYRLFDLIILMQAVFFWCCKNQTCFWFGVSESDLIIIQDQKYWNFLNENTIDGGVFEHHWSSSIPIIHIPPTLYHQKLHLLHQPSALIPIHWK